MLECFYLLPQFTSKGHIVTKFREQEWGIFLSFRDGLIPKEWLEKVEARVRLGLCVQ